MKMLRKSIKPIIFTTIALSIVWFASFWITSREFSKPHQFETRYNSGLIGANKIKVALIGDSWVAGKKLDSFLASYLRKGGWEPEIISFGQRGARSKIIYENLFKPNSEANSSQEVLFGEPFDICVVIAGVNDTSSYIGADFYAHHVSLIVDSLTKRGIFPFILEVPEFGIEKAESKNPVGFLRRHLMRIAYHAGKVDVINDYRETLNKTLGEKFQSDQYTIINFDTVSTDYTANKNLYAQDSIHLSEEGRNLLALTIAHAINNRLSKNISAESLSVSN